MKWGASKKRWNQEGLQIREVTHDIQKFADPGRKQQRPLWDLRMIRRNGIAGDTGSARENPINRDSPENLLSFRV